LQQAKANKYREGFSFFSEPCEHDEGVRADMPKWFAAKTLYRTFIEGSPTAPDAEALAEWPPAAGLLASGEVRSLAAAVIEERVVLFFAETHDEAIALAETEAAAYVTDPLVNTLNIYGQRVARRPLEYVETYEMPDAPANGVEVFSRTFLCRASEKDDDIVDRIAPDDEVPSKARKLFEMNLERTYGARGRGPA
jgi:hypothetical protein